MWAILWNKIEIAAVQQAFLSVSKMHLIFFFVMDYIWRLYEHSWYNSISTWRSIHSELNLHKGSSR